MNELQAVILGVVEGLTEFLPVSSTAHLILTSALMHLAEDEFVKSFEIVIQLAAIMAVVVLFWRKFLNWETILKLGVAFIPTGIIGLTVYKALKQYLLGNIPVVISAMFLGGVVLLLFERFKPQRFGEPDFREITYKKAFLIGLFQSIAIIPGVSRSAATIVGGSMLGIGKRTIVEFSFMLAVPTMMAASALELLKNYKALGGHADTLAIGLVVSFVTAIIAIKSFIGYLKKRDFTLFGYYRIALASVFVVCAYVLHVIQL